MKRTLCILLAIVTFVGSIITAKAQEVFASDEDNYVCKYLEGKENLTVQEVNANWPTYKILENPEVDTTNLKVVFTETDPEGDVWEALVGYITWKDYSFFFTGWRNKKTGIVLDNLGDYSGYEQYGTYVTGIDNQKQLEELGVEEEYKYICKGYPGYYPVNAWYASVSHLPFNTLPKDGITVSYSKKGIVDFKVVPKETDYSLQFIWKPLKVGSTTVTIKFEDYGCKPIYHIYKFKVCKGTKFGCREALTEDYLDGRIAIECYTYKTNELGYKRVDKTIEKHIPLTSKTFMKSQSVSNLNFGKDKATGKKLYPEYVSSASSSEYDYSLPFFEFPSPEQADGYTDVKIFDSLCDHFDVNMHTGIKKREDIINYGYSIGSHGSNSIIYGTTAENRIKFLPEVVEESNNEFSKDFMSRFLWAQYKRRGLEDYSKDGTGTGFVARMVVNSQHLRRKKNIYTYVKAWQGKTKMMCAETAAVVAALFSVQNDYVMRPANDYDVHQEAVVVINGFAMFKGLSLSGCFGCGTEDGRIEVKYYEEPTPYREPKTYIIDIYPSSSDGYSGPSEYDLFKLIVDSIPEYRYYASTISIDVEEAWSEEDRSFMLENDFICEDVNDGGMYYYRASNGNFYDVYYTTALESWGYKVNGEWVKIENYENLPRFTSIRVKKLMSNGGELYSYDMFGERKVIDD